MTYAVDAQHQGSDNTVNLALFFGPIAPELPAEVITRILSNLNPDALGRCCLVSRAWKALASDYRLWNAFDLSATFSIIQNSFDDQAWHNHVGMDSLKLTVNDVAPLDKRSVISVLKTRDLSALSIAENSGVTLLTIPKGLTLNKLVNAFETNIPSEGILNEIGDVEIEKTYRTLITNHYLTGSLGKYISDQYYFVTKNGWQMPTLLEATALLAVTCMYFKEDLYINNAITCTERMFGYNLAARVTSNSTFSVSTIFGFFGPDDDPDGAYTVLRL